jgi:hypothetical protein
MEEAPKRLEHDVHELEELSEDAPLPRYRFGAGGH